METYTESDIDDTLLLIMDIEQFWYIPASWIEEVYEQD